MTPPLDTTINVPQLEQSVTSGGTELVTVVSPSVEPVEPPTCSSHMEEPDEIEIQEQRQDQPMNPWTEYLKGFNSMLQLERCGH